MKAGARIPTESVEVRGTKAMRKEKNSKGISMWLSALN